MDSANLSSILIQRQKLKTDLNAFSQNTNLKECVYDYFVIMIIHTEIIKTFAILITCMLMYIKNRNIWFNTSKSQTF